MVCQAVHLEESESVLYRRGSGSRSPSPTSSRGKALFFDDDRSGGLLGDVVQQALRRPSTPAHASHAGPAHPAQAAYLHAIHPSHEAHFPAAHGEQATHLHVAHPNQATHSLGQPSQLAHHLPTHHLAGHPAQLAHNSATHPEGTPQSPPKSKEAGNLRHLVEGLRSVPAKPRRPVGRPRKAITEFQAPKKQPGENSQMHAPPTKKPLGTPKRGPWWKQEGGTPGVQRGTAKYYDINRRYREKKKLMKQGKQADQHPPGPHHQPPKGGGPGSPSAGSQAVSK